MRNYPIVFLILSGFALGLTAAIQNQTFYTMYSAFYDSMAYFNQLAWVMQNTQDKGFWLAITDSYSHSTVFFPWLLAACLSYITEPTRILGVIIQMPLVMLQVFTGYRFFISTGASRWRAVLYTLPLITYPAVFTFNGGLSDFRMDISQAFAYGSFLAALMVARKRNSLKEWAFVGFIISVACLFRATTPVYVFMVLSVGFLLDSFKLGFTQALQRYSIVGIVVIVLTGWFYLLNYEHLHYYYFVWNTDANARLPLSSSVTHLSFILQHIGSSLFIALLIAIAAVAWSFARNCKWHSFSLNWIALIGGLVPASYLVLSGAGLNPFVSMVAVPGFILFALHIGESSNASVPISVNRILIIALTIALTVSISTSIRNSGKDISDWIPYKQGVASLVGSISHDAETRKLDDVMLTFLYLGSVDEAVITNHLIYEEGFKYLQNRKLNKNGVTFGMLRHGFGANAEWINIPGANDQEKISYVVEQSMKKANYIIVADESSTLPTHHRINGYAGQIRTYLQTSQDVEEVMSGITLSKSESATVYRVKKNVYLK